MDKDLIVEMIRKRLKLDDQEWAIIVKNPKFQRLFPEFCTILRVTVGK
jgi:hypothetical protein